jgi:hypothetical protein
MHQTTFAVSYTVGRFPAIKKRIKNFDSYIDALKYSNMLRRANNQPTINEVKPIN